MTKRMAYRVRDGEKWSRWFEADRIVSWPGFWWIDGQWYDETAIELREPLVVAPATSEEA